MEGEGGDKMKRGREGEEERGKKRRKEGERGKGGRRKGERERDVKGYTYTYLITLILPGTFVHKYTLPPPHTLTSSPVALYAAHGPQKASDSTWHRRLPQGRGWGTSSTPHQVRGWGTRT